MSKSLAEVGVPTLVVGGAFRKPEVHRLLGATSAQSLQDMAKLDTDRLTIGEIIQFPEGLTTFSSRLRGRQLARSQRSTRRPASCVLRVRVEARP